MVRINQGKVLTVLKLGLLAFVIVCVACTKGAPARDPECVNRCMQECQNQPEALEPRNMAVPAEGHMGNTMSGCDQTCTSRC